MSALVSGILLILIQIITVFWAKNYFGLISAWVAGSEQMSGPKGDEFDMIRPRSLKISRKWPR